MGKIIKNYNVKNGFTTMLNDHFKDKRLSWGAIGMLSNAFSLPDNWEFSVMGFKGMHADGEKAVRTLLFELEWFGYLQRHQIRNKKGVILDYDYEFFNTSQKMEFVQPVPKWEDRKKYKQELKIVIVENAVYDMLKMYEDSVNTESHPYRQNADMDNADMDNADMDNADMDKADTVKADTVNEVQLSTKKLSTNNLKQIKSNHLTKSEIQSEFDRIKGTINYNAFVDEPIEIKTLLDDIVNTVVYEVCCVADETQINLGTKVTPAYHSVIILKDIFDKNLNFSIIKTYMDQFYKSGKQVTNASAYHLKSLYRQCLGHSTQGQSKYKNNYN